METINSSREAILADIRQALKRTGDSPVAPRPAIVPPRVAGTPDEEIDRLIREITALQGEARRLETSDVRTALAGLVQAENVRKATLWSTERLAELGIADTLRELGVEIIPGAADKHALAQADLGVTEADFALPETGTLGLLSSPEKPRAVSLLPRVHLAIIHPRALRADLHQVFAEAKSQGYLILITGPSRTSDIELVVTIGVHGPQRLYAWVIAE
jgi:L-lactate dehydrogenase complex protein LldG